MRSCLKWLLLMLAVPMACRQGELPDPSGRRVDPGALSHGMIELGEQLEDPYSVENMREALAALYPTRAGEIPVSTTDLYVRFLPADEEQYAAYTGGTLSLALRNLEFLLETAGKERITVRIPEIPGYTSPEDQERTKEKLESMGLSQFDLFRYVVFEKERTADDRI